MKKKKINIKNPAEDITPEAEADKLSSSDLDKLENILTAYAEAPLPEIPDSSEPSDESDEKVEAADTSIEMAETSAEEVSDAKETEDTSDEADGAEESSDDISGDSEEEEEEVEEEGEEDLTPFEKSIKDFKVTDADAPAKKKNPFDIVRLAVLIICTAVCVVSTVILIRNVTDKVRGEQIYGEIIDNFADGFSFDGNVKNDGGKLDLLASDLHASYTPTMNDIIMSGIVEDSTHADHSAELARMRASLESLRNINPDIYGWIKIPGTKINYPIAQTDDNTYYLDHAYTGDNLVNGSIFADYRADASPMMNYNTVLYGHNIKDGSMFNNVSKFFEEETFNNTLIYLYTFSGIYVYKPFSVHETEYDSGFIAMGMSSEKFVEFATQMRNESAVPSSKEFTYRDRMITLSTCTNGVNTRRFALHGYLVQKITD